MSIERLDFVCSPTSEAMAILGTACPVLFARSSKILYAASLSWISAAGPIRLWPVSIKPSSLNARYVRVWLAMRAWSSSSVQGSRIKSEQPASKQASASLAVPLAISGTCFVRGGYSRNLSAGTTTASKPAGLRASASEAQKKRENGLSFPLVCIDAVYSSSLPTKRILTSDLPCGF